MSAAVASSCGVGVKESMKTYTNLTNVPVAPHSWPSDAWRGAADIMGNAESLPLQAAAASADIDHFSKALKEYRKQIDARGKVQHIGLHAPILWPVQGYRPQDL